MAKEEKVILEGSVTDILPDGQYTVEIEGGHQILGYTSGKMRRFNIRIVVGDKVTIETSPIVTLVTWELVDPVPKATVQQGIAVAVVNLLEIATECSHPLPQRLGGVVISILHGTPRPGPLNAVARHTSLEIV